MRKNVPSFIAGIVFGLSLTAGVAIASGPFDSAFRSLRAAADDGAQIRGLALQVREPYMRDQLLMASDRLNHHIDDARDSLRDVRDAVPRGPVVASEADFSRILSAMDAQAFDDDKMVVLRDASRGRAFTTDQVIRVVNQLTFSSAKVDAAAMMYPMVADPQNWYRVYGGLTFSSDRDALRQRTTG